jgi:hypothetical protein
VEDAMTDDEQLAPISEEFATQFRARPQLRLHHFFVLTAVAAVLLAINGPQQNYWAGADFAPPRLFTALMTAWSVLNVMLVSIAITAIAYGIMWQRRGLLFFDQPGHWLLVEIGIVGLFGLVPAIAYRWLFSEFDFQSGNLPGTAFWIVWAYSMFVMLIVPLALNIYFGVKQCCQTRWSMVFYFKAVANILCGLGTIVVFVMLLLAIRGDRSEGITRDPAHWCGVWVQLAHSALAMTVAFLTIGNMFYMMSAM